MLNVAQRWFGLRRDLGERYSPLYFLASLGNGGMAVAFFIYLNFMVPHPQTPIVTFDSIAAFLNGAGVVQSFLVFLGMAAILFFAFRHLRLLFWNLREYAAFRRTPAYERMLNNNSAVATMALPLTLGMTVNVLFATGAVFVPGLWNIVEYLFPFSLTALLLVGILALRIFMNYFGRMLMAGNFDYDKNNSFSQLQAAMAFSMVAVGLAAPAAMSGNKITITVSILASMLFLGAAVLIGLPKMILGLRGMLLNGLNLEAGASLWIPIPILTLAGIALLRISHGLHHGFGLHTTEPGMMFLLTGSILMLQLNFAVGGFIVLHKVGYFRTYLMGEGRSPASYALICPGVALFVFGMFFLHVGLVQNGVVDKFSFGYYAVLAPLVAIQIVTIASIFQLDSKLIRPEVAAAPAVDPVAAR
ncbi:TsoY family (seleno)protein [Candidatus Chloroploca asiatica]|nr:hypothetical protein [Candidatus Chloroploca asiatica]